MISTRDALTGPWAANLPGWASTAIPASLIVIVQELFTDAPDGGWIAASVLLQLVAVSAWTVLVASIARMLTGRVPPVALGILWVGIGLLRGVIGALVALEAGAPPEWLYRIAFWTIVTVCWIPLLTYALAQWDEHLRLLSERAATGAALDVAAVRASESEEARIDRLTTAADDALGPGLDEVRAGLRGLEGRFDPADTAAIGARLDELTRRAAAFTTPDPVPTPARSAARVSVRDATREFELRRPVFAALLTAGATAPILLPESFRHRGLEGVLEMALAVVVATVLVAATFGILRPPRFSPAFRSFGGRIGVGLAGLGGAAIFVALHSSHFEPRDTALVALIPFVVVSAAGATSTAVALAATNVALTARLGSEHAALADLRAHIRAADEEAAARVETLIRGDLNGRLASCAMALGFLTHGDVEPESGPRVVRGILDQLDRAAAELHTPSPGSAEWGTPGGTA